MKFKIVVLVFFFLSTSLSAQVLYQESFDSGVPSDWTSIDSDGDGFFWGDVDSIMRAWGYSYYIGNYIHSGDNSLMSVSYDSPNDVSLYPDNWLVSPAISIPSEGLFKLSWFDINFQVDDADSYSVYISTVADINSFAQPVLTLTPAGSFVERSVGLQDYSGQNIYVAFRHHDSPGHWGVIIDDLSVSALTIPAEIKLVSLDIPFSVEFPDSLVVGGRVCNMGSEGLRSFEVQYTVRQDYNSTGTPVVCSISGLNVPYGDTVSFSHAVPAHFESAGNYVVELQVSSPNGSSDNLSDNTLSCMVGVCGDSVPLPYFSDFSNALGCWTAFDADGDGHSWSSLSSVFPSWGYSRYLPYYAHSGTDALISYSFDEGDSLALNPDNWLFSPRFYSGGSALAVQFEVSQLNNSFGDRYAVYAISDADTVELYSGRAPASYEHQTLFCDASFSVSQIAFRHFNSEGQAGILIDDFQIESRESILPCNNAKVRVYPNPTTSLLFIDSDAPVCAQVFDMMGRKVLERHDAAVLDFSLLPKGCYAVSIQTADGPSLIKVLRQ